MRILITGSDGYIGSACVREFSRQGWNVRATSRKPIKQPLLKSVENVYGLSLTDAVDWASYLKNVDAVVHRPDASSIEYRRVNIESTERIAAAAEQSGVSQFIFLSTISVYGQKAGVNPINESTPFAPDNAYSESKVDAEALIVKIANGSRMAWTILRPPLVYGPNAPGNFRRLVKMIQAGVPLPLAAANQPRSYIGLDNLVSAIMRTATHQKARNQGFVVSDGQDISTSDLISLVAKALGCRSRLWWMPELAIRTAATLAGRSADASKLFDSLQIDSTKIRHQLGWAAPIPLEEGVHLAVQHSGVT